MYKDGYLVIKLFDGHVISYNWCSKFRGKVICSGTERVPLEPGGQSGGDPC